MSLQDGQQGYFLHPPDPATSQDAPFLGQGRNE
jgi:hypothetical protein